MGEERFCRILESMDVEMITAFREKYIDLLRQYYYVGGMPEVVKHFVENKDFNQARALQKNLLDYYQQAFSKHAPIHQVTRLNQVWNVIPSQLAKENKKFIYGQIREGARAKDFELAIQCLSDCGLIHKVMRIKKPDMPLAAYMDFPSFKIFMVDIGLLGAMSLRVFCEKYQTKKGIRTSMSDYREQDWMVNVPLYMLPVYLKNRGGTSDPDFPGE